MKRIKGFLVISQKYQNTDGTKTYVVPIDCITRIEGNEENTSIETDNLYVRIYKPINDVLKDFEKALEGYEWM